MSAKKTLKDLNTKEAFNEIRNFVATGQAAQEAADRLEDPIQILDRFGGEVLDFCRKLKRHQAYFQERKINPFHRLQVICREKCLLFLDNFDKVAGMKAKE